MDGLALGVSTGRKIDGLINGWKDGCRDKMDN